MSNTDPKVQWGVVNAAHPDFTDVVQAITWAQQNHYKTVYISAGGYTIQTPIVINTPDLHSGGLDNGTLG